MLFWNERSYAVLGFWRHWRWVETCRMDGWYSKQRAYSELLKINRSNPKNFYMMHSSSQLSWNTFINSRQMWELPGSDTCHPITGVDLVSFWPTRKVWWHKNLLSQPLSPILPWWWGLRQRRLCLILVNVERVNKTNIWVSFLLTLKPASRKTSTNHSP